MLRENPVMKYPSKDLKSKEEKEFRFKQEKEGILKTVKKKKV